MKAGIIAAGLGERFRAAGVATPKALLEVGGKTLLARAVESAAAAGAEEVALIVNAEYPELARAVAGRSWPVPLHTTVRTTPSSMESFFALAPRLQDSPFLLLTVDAVFAAGALAALAEAGARNGPAGTLGITSFVDDEKPLWARIDARREITALGPEATGSGWVTSGIYFFHPVVYSLVGEARARKLSALRQFLALVRESGHRLFAHDVGASVDVDRPEDLAVAEEFVRSHGGA